MFFACYKANVAKAAADLFLIVTSLKCRARTWFYASVVDWMEADLNVSLQSIVIKEFKRTK